MGVANYPASPPIYEHWLIERVHDYDDFAWTPRPELALLARGHTPWQYYLDTMVQFDTPEHGGIVRPCDTGDGQSTPPFGPLHVVTAIQPDPEPDEVSRARMLVLDRYLHGAGLRSIPAVGSSFSGDHSEDSRAVFGLTDHQARELGVRFGQVAVFAWNGPRWSLLACADDSCSHRGWQWEHSPTP